jgi:hypothetical protein
VTDNPDSFGPSVGLLQKGAAWAGVGETGRNASTINAALKQRAQIIGKYLEGGKMTDSDIVRYQQSLPQFGDSPEVAQNKIQGLQRLVAQKQEAEKRALGEAGYDVAGLSGSDMPEMPKTKKQGNILRETEAHAGAEQIDERDIQALQWLKANPTSPDAEGVRKKLMMKGLVK